MCANADKEDDDVFVGGSYRQNQFQRYQPGTDSRGVDSDEESTTGDEDFFTPKHGE